MRWIIVCVLVGAGYWYFFDLTAESGGPSYAQKIRANKSAMATCVREAEYAASRMAVSAANAEAECASKLKLYFEDGGWHGYKDSRE